jgi:hypothetical protein
VPLVRATPFQLNFAHLFRQESSIGIWAKPEPGAQPVAKKTYSGGAKPRLTSGG